MSNIRYQHVRYAALAGILGWVIYLALGYGSRSFEAYCPFGGVESLWALLTTGEFTCALGPLNLSLMIAVFLLALIAKKAFCAWVCPIGFLGELAARLGGRVWRKRPQVPGGVDHRLKSLRYLVLAAALVLTYYSGELVLRGYDPFYLIFSGMGHGSVGVVSAVVLGVLVVGAFLVPMSFCRYLCPLGAVLDPLSRLGLIRIRRDESKCTACGLCGHDCPQRIPVPELSTVRHRDCTNCLTCLDACPQPGALRLGIGARGPAIPSPQLVLPSLALVALIGGVGLRVAFTQPTSAQVFVDEPGAQVTFTVNGIRCRGTAQLFTSLYEDTPGIHAIRTYATERQAVFTFNTNLITREEIRAIMEMPIPFTDGTTSRVFQCVSMH